MSYRYYRLCRKTATRTDASTLLLRKTLESLELPFREPTFTGEGLIIIFDFLTRLVEETDTLDISEGHMMVLLGDLLIKGAGEQYCTNTNVSSTGTSGGIIHYLDAVQYMLRTYVNDTEICEAFDDFLEVRPSPTENETIYSARLNRVSYRCGNVQEEEDKITLYIKGLQPSIRTIVSPYRNNQPSYWLTLERLV